MSRIESHLRELKCSFISFRGHAKKATDSKNCCLDMLYAVECGLTATILRERREETTVNILIKTSHNLLELLKMCKSISTTSPIPSQFAIKALKDARTGKNIRKGHIPQSDLHSVLRYGVDIEESEWMKCAKVLDEICEQLDVALKRR